jgi:hypothetical protein
VKPSLDGVRRKIARANTHLEDLKLELVKGLSADAHNTTRIDNETQGVIVEGHIANVSDVTMDARILIGDVVHSLAAALDHLVYQLSLSHTRDSVRCDNHKTHFPIFVPPLGKDDLKRIDKRLALMAKVPADIIRAMQPYKRSAADPSLDPLSDPLWILFKLDVIDKHRLVLATNQVAAVKHVTISAPGIETEIVQFFSAPWQPFKAGTKLFEFTLDPGYQPNPETHFNPNCDVVVHFAETGLWCDDKPVVAVLTKLIEYIVKVVVDPLARYVV